MRASSVGVAVLGAVFALALPVTGCGNDNPNGRDGGALDGGGDAGTPGDAGVDAGLVDAGDANDTCDVAGQMGCDAGESCLLYQLPSSDFGSACFSGECDLVAQNCPAGQKCTYVSDGGVSVRACTADGTDGEGAPCSLTATSNTCQKGLVCLPKTLPDGDAGTFCARFCYSNGDCANGEACFLTVAPNGNSERPLVCARPCDLFAQDCPPGRGCYPGPTAPGCYPEGTVADGEPCTFSDECRPGSACVQQQCAPLCAFPDGTPGCASGTCTPLAIPGVSDAGACLDM
ncbi:MAG: hypothetical protein IRZ16_00260 [Myxococcaceae bacterium]|nr:hypothetical protein [Myxococcaceae bacterium]